MNALTRHIQSSQENALMALLLLIGGVLGVKDLWNAVVPGELGVYIIGLVFVLIFIYQIRTNLRIGSLKPIPIDSKFFHPFKLAAGQVWQRKAEADELTAKIKRATHSHVVLSGPSGAGKSTLLLKLVAPHLEPAYFVRPYDRYGNILRNILSEIDPPQELSQTQTDLLARYEAFTKNNKCSTREVFGPGFSASKTAAMELWVPLRTYFEAIFSDPAKQFCFMFDQTERYINVVRSEIERDGNKLNGYEVFFFVKFIRLCRKQANCRTVFVIRAEYLYDSFDFLETITCGTADAPKAVSYFLCPGINSISAPDGAKEIRSQFKRLPAAADLFVKFERVVGLDNRTYSNTFLAQLFGFLVEHFYTNDQKVKTMLIEEKDRSLALRYFFDHLFNDYFRQTRSRHSIDVLKCMLFTVAIENRLTGQSVTENRIARLSHIPQDEIAVATVFLHDIGILVQEQDDDTICYRLVHDLVSDYVIENDLFAVQPGMKEDIRGLSEQRTESESIEEVGRYANLITDWNGRINPGLIAIWVFFVFGSLRLKGLVCDWASMWFLAHAPQSESCTLAENYYLPIYFMHVVWLTFIYHMHRDHLRYALHWRSLRFVSGSASVIGAGLAIYLSQSPTLFVIPVFVGGFLMSIALLGGCLAGSFVGRAARENWGWGFLTLFNMMISVLLTVLAWLVLWNDKIAQQFWDHVGGTFFGSIFPWAANQHKVSVVVMYLLNGVMIYFWFHIRSKQQRPISFAARLTLYDRTRSEKS